MPELPEITVISRQMNEELRGKTIEDIESRQPKNLNMPAADFTRIAAGKTVSGVSSKGKWIVMKLRPDHDMLINLGMYGELLYHQRDSVLPEKYQFRLRFTDGTCFTIFFSWFGYIHLVSDQDLARHKMVGPLGISPIETSFTKQHLAGLVKKRKTSLKNLMLDQKLVSGIGNVYAQDTLFRARLHPLRKTNTLSSEEIDKLFDGIKETLDQSINLGGLAYEKDFYGTRGGYSSDSFLVAYKEGKPCPICGTTIEKIRTGSTASYICPKCQHL